MATITSPGRTGFGGGTRASAASPWRHVDLTLIGAVLAIAALGMLMVYSATRNALEFNNLDPQYYLQRQAIFVGVGLCVMVAATVFDYRFFRDRAAMLYGGTLFLLLLVISPLGSNKKGTQAWFQLGPYQLQPSEFAKITLIIAIAAFVGSARGAELDLRRFLTVLAIGGAPIGLVYLQPDLGTALVSLAILLGMLLVAGAKAKHLAALVLLGVVAMVAVVQLGVLKQYQLDRLSAFLDPAGDTQRSTYNLAQSKTAIGSGGVSGKGLFQGTQTNLSYVPEQHTDFIFTAVGEQLGLVGSAALLSLFAIVVWRTWRSAALARDPSGTMICVGVLAMFTFQIFENVGMAMGIMPITGIPLPFMSYGGSSTLASFAAIGLVLNVHMRRFS
jgi:rod shape determining protein RodA